MAATASDLLLITSILEVRLRVENSGKAARYIYLRPGYLEQLREEIRALLDQGASEAMMFAGLAVIEREGLPEDYDFLVMPEALESN